MATRRRRPRRKRLWKRWSAQREQARTGLQFEHLEHRAIPGTAQICAFIPDCPWPIGTVWYRLPGQRHVEILWSYVIPWARRCGVRTAMHNKMVEWYPGHGIFTAETNRRSKPWLRKAGFVEEAIGWRWAPGGDP